MRKKLKIKYPTVPSIEKVWLALSEDGIYEIDGLGTLEVVEIKGRKTYNPATKGEAYMQPYKKVKFKVSTDLNSFLN